VLRSLSLRHATHFLQSIRPVRSPQGQNVAIEYRCAEGQDGRFPALAADLVRRNVDLIGSCCCRLPPFKVMPLRPAQRLLEAIVGPSHYPQAHEDDAERTVRSRTFRPKCPPARRWGQPGALPKHTRNEQDPDAYSPPGATRAYTNAGDRSKVPQGTLRGEPASCSANPVLTS
jgi:hypothetical protein